MKLLIFPLNANVFSTVRMKTIISKVQFDVIITSLPVEVLLYIDSSIV